MILGWWADKGLKVPRFHFVPTWSCHGGIFHDTGDQIRRVRYLWFRVRFNIIEAESRVRNMTAAMVHRGPDEDGFLVNDPAGAGAPR